MNISILTVGKLKEKYWKEAVLEYSKRLSAFCNLKIIEIKEEKAPNNPKEAEIQKVKQLEGEEILKKIKPEDFVITLEIQGFQLSSEELASKFKELANSGDSQIKMVIGGSFGLSEEVSRRSNYKLSFSKMTFPHQMMRVILLEQIYRAFKINSGQKYHK